MAVIVTRPNNLVINTEQQAIDYLTGVATRPRSPLERGNYVYITNRSQLPSNVGNFDVGIVVESPSDSPTAFILVLNVDGGTAVVAIPKNHIASF